MSEALIYAANEMRGETPVDMRNARDEWDRTTSQRALDELFSTARRYRNSKEFKALLDFTVKFRSYAPFNAMLTHVQVPSQRAGSIRRAEPGRTMSYTVRVRPECERQQVPVRHEMLSHASLSKSARYATLVHELAHLYCGHLGTPDEKWWPNRMYLSHGEMEFEAESISYLGCEGLGILSPSAEHLERFIGSYTEVPQISLEPVMKVAGLIEQMGRERMPLRTKSSTKKKDTPR